MRDGIHRWSAAVLLGAACFCARAAVAAEDAAALAETRADVMMLVQHHLPNALDREERIVFPVRIGNMRAAARILSFDDEHVSVVVNGSRLSLRWGQLSVEGVSALGAAVLPDGWQKHALFGRLYLAAGDIERAIIQYEAARAKGADIEAESSGAMKTLARAAERARAAAQARREAEAARREAARAARTGVDVEFTPARGRVFYVDGRNSSGGDGSRQSPWPDVARAAKSIRPGDMVIIARGVYRAERVQFGPSGEGPARMTVYRAAPGARVIFTQPDGETPKIHLGNYVRIRGLWFGGTWRGEGKKGKSGGEEKGGIFGPGGSTNSPGGKEIVGCTIFGYTGGILIGTSYDLFIHGCRVVRCGGGHFSHGIYMSGGYAPNVSHHVVVDKCMFLAGEGYGIHEWHYPNSMVITRNVVARHSYGIVVSGSDHLVANNLVWKSKGFTSGPNGLHFAARNVIAVNNILGPNARVIGNADKNVFRNTAFIGVPGAGENRITLSRDAMPGALGIAEAEFDATVAALDRAFARPAEEIYRDESIEPLFAKLRTALPQGSCLRAGGESWFEPGARMRVGPCARAPRTKAAFWDAFHRLGLDDWDHNGKRVARAEEK